jgi:hypothetical protein
MSKQAFARSLTELDRLISIADGSSTESLTIPLAEEKEKAPKQEGEATKEKKEKKPKEAKVIQRSFENSKHNSRNLLARQAPKPPKPVAADLNQPEITNW